MVPLLKDEIERKCFEAVEYLITAVQKGGITQEQFKTGIDVAWMCCAGLVSRDMIELMTYAKDEASRRKSESDFSGDFA